MRQQFLFAALITLLPGIAFSDNHGGNGDVAEGEKVFRKCKACHEVGDGAANKVGPALNGVVGSPVAAADGFKYSKVLTELGNSGTVWTAEELSAFLEKPRSYAKGSKMSFAGLRKEDDRANVIAYLATFPK